MKQLNPGHMKPELVAKVAGTAAQQPPAHSGTFDRIAARVEQSIASAPAAWALGLGLYSLISIFQASRGKLFWFDELSTFYISRLPTFRDMLRAIPYDGHPPVLYVLTRWSQQLFGGGEV